MNINELSEQEERKDRKLQNIQHSPSPGAIFFLFISYSFISFNSSSFYSIKTRRLIRSGCVRPRRGTEVNIKKFIIKGTNRNERKFYEYSELIFDMLDEFSADTTRLIGISLFMHRLMKFLKYQPNVNICTCLLIFIHHF